MSSVTSSERGDSELNINPGLLGDIAGAIPPAVSLETVRCGNRSCPGLGIADKLLPCQNPSCKRKFHLTCFQERFRKEKWPKLREGQVVCTKACYNKLANPPRLNWTNDGKGGIDDPCSSERILLDWLMFPGNYANKWRGKDNKGRKKNQVAGDIAKLINDSGVLVKRDNRQVKNKIQHLERQFREAFDFANTETGAGLKEGDLVLFDDAVMQRCPHYYDLVDIFADRASSKAKATNMDLSLASSDTDNDSISDGDEKQSDDERRSSGKKTRAVSSLSSHKKRRARSPVDMTLGDTSAATVRLANMKSDLLSLQVAKLQEDREMDKETKKLDSQLHLVRQCIAFVAENPGWPKEDVLAVFPAFESVIDKVYRNKKDD